jgi:hypothetical protein
LTIWPGNFFFSFPCFPITLEDFLKRKLPMRCDQPFIVSVNSVISVWAWKPSMHEHYKYCKSILILVNAPKSIHHLSITIADFSLKLHPRLDCTVEHIGQKCWFQIQKIKFRDRNRWFRRKRRLELRCLRYIFGWVELDWVKSPSSHNRPGYSESQHYRWTVVTWQRLIGSIVSYRSGT